MSEMMMQKQRRQQSGQMALEYIIIFAIVAGLTLVTLTSWDNNIRTSLEQFYLDMVSALQ